MEDTLKNRSDVSVVLLFFIVLTIVGILGAAYIVKDYSRARASVGWPIYQGVVLSPRDGRESFRYAYSVDGRTYDGTRRRFVTAVTLPRETINDAPGQLINVYVYPNDHAVSVLQPGGAGGFFAAGTLFFGAAVFFGIGGIVRTLTLAAPKTGAPGGAMQNVSSLTE